jgi:hypothetical protein
MMVERLLRQQIKPRWLVLEMVPRLLASETDTVAVNGAAGQDLPVLQPYVSPWRLWGIYLRNRLDPWYRYRQAILLACAPAWVTACAGDLCVLDPLGGDTSWLAQADLSETERRRRCDAVCRGLLKDFEHFRIARQTDRAVRDLLDRCRQEGIQVLLLQTPESTAYRSCYPSEVVEQSDAYLAALVREYGLPMVDARAWVPDRMFVDGHHLMLDGAAVFTHRLAREVLEPLVQDRLGGQGYALWTDEK